MSTSRSRSWWTGALLGAIAVATAGVLAAACTSGSTPSVAHLGGHGSGGSPASGTLTQAQSDQDMVDFARCLRAHGVDEPDPTEVAGHGLRLQFPTPGPRTNPALAACNHFIVGIEREKAAGRGALDIPALTSYAQCMRAHDIAMLDPTVDGQLNLGQVPGIASDFGRYSPQFRAADTVCRHLLPAGVHDDGTGP